MKTKILIVLRGGSDSLYRSWTSVCANIVDVAISVFDDSPIDAAAFVATNRSPGGKYQGLQAFFAENAWVIDAYTHFWLMDDDLYLPFRSLLETRDMIERFGFALCAPSLAPESFMSWALMIRNESFYLRATDFVEVMAPIMSRDFLRRALPYFGENRSSWGYEWLWRGFLTEMNTFAAILDAAPIVHTRPVGKSRLYEDASGARLDAAAEADALFAKYAIEKDAVPFSNLFALGRRDRRLVRGPDFLIQALRGYPSLPRDNPEYHRRCVEFLLTSPRALDSVEAILAFSGAAALLSETPP